MSHRKVWTIGEVESRRAALNKVAAILERVSLTHAGQQRRLDVIEHRIKNMSTAISNVPEDILIHIFVIARFECGVSPELLASVCHRWLAVVHGALGAPLWSELNLHMAYNVAAIAITRKTTRYLERSRTYPISYKLSADRGVSAEEMDQLRVITKASMSRCTDIDVTPFVFRSWFPLQGPLRLRRLRISDYVGFSVTGKYPSSLLKAQCPSLRELEIFMTGPAASECSIPLLENVSKFAAITHLRIEVMDFIDARLLGALASFHNLRFLYWCDTYALPRGRERAIALSLPQLERLVLHSSHAGFRVFPILDAPLLRHLELFASPTEYPAHWALLNPVRFPNLQTLYSSTADRDMYRIAAAIECHPKLRNVRWKVEVRSISKSIRSFSSFLRKDVLGVRSRPLLHQLGWFSIVPTQPLPSHPESNSLYTKIAHEVAKFAILWDETPAERRSNFKLCLDNDLVRASQEISRVVEEHPDIILPRVHPLE